MVGKSRATFIFDDEFDSNLLHWKDTLNPIGDRFRSVADRIKRAAVANAKKEANEALSQQIELSGDRYKPGMRAGYLRAKAMAYSMRVYAELLFAAEVHGEPANYAIVSSGHAAADRIEYGGADDVIKVGESPLTYPALGILRRSL